MNKIAVNESSLMFLSKVFSISIIFSLSLSCSQDQAGISSLKKETESPDLTYTTVAGSVVQPLTFNEDEKAKIFIFTTIDCPVANGYSPEISKLSKEYKAKGVQFYLVHVDPDTSVEIAKKHAEEYSLNLPILLDPQHKLVEFTGAEITPEATLVTPDKKIAYRGRIDNLYADYGKKRRQVTVKDLELAIGAVLSGMKVAVPRTEVVGCIIADFKK